MQRRDTRVHPYSNMYPTRCNVTQFISGNCSTCFGWYLHPSPGAHTTESTASGTCQTVLDRIKLLIKRTWGYKNMVWLKSSLCLSCLV